MNEKIFLEEATPRQKKIKIDESNNRQQCWITCGADVVIRHILPYLIITVADEKKLAPTQNQTLIPSDSNVSSDDRAAIVCNMKVNFIAMSMSIF
jgi:hypothetical protein